jgi:uncharacterized protein (DUF362 family)
MESIPMHELRVGLATQKLPSTPDYEACYADPEVLRRLIREALRQSGLGQKDPDAPFADIVPSGATVLLKPNWVRHLNSSGHTMACTVTHPKFILATMEEVLKAKPGRVILGDAPIQGCDWDVLLPAAFQEQVIALGRSHGIPVEFVDFRRIIVPGSNLVRGTEVRTVRNGRDICFNLASDSLIEPVSSPPGRFRGICYDPDTLARTHYPGCHEYLLCREAFEADVVISLPKLKTHRRSCLTAALKNLVGLNGDKDRLPHHRVGGTASGGDCYPGRSFFRRMGEFFEDSANRHIGSRLYLAWIYPYAVIRRLFTTPETGSLEAAWYGNDTTWRMVLDLNRILLHGRPDGTMADAPQRRLFSLTDAIICGQGEGPLSPTPLLLGAVTFSDCAPAADAVHAALLQMDYRRIPLIREAFGRFRWPLAAEGGVPTAVCNGQSMSVDEVVARIGVKARLPAGWMGHVEWNG